jgi:MFS family permease
LTDTGGGTAGAPSAPRWPVLTVLVPFALLFALCNYYRTVNAVLAPHFIHDLGLDAAQLGLLVSIYFLMSALFQAPLGLLMDRFGPRRVQATLITIAGIGAAMFALGDSWPVLLAGRAIMGLGAAGGLMTGLMAVTLWFPAARWPLFNGFVMALGATGSLVATEPTQFLLGYADWHQILLGVAVISVVAGGLLLWIVPEKERQATLTMASQLQGVATIFRDRLFWRFAPMYMAAVGSTMAFQSLWAGPWLHDVAQLDPEHVATGLLAMSILQIASYFGVGLLATELNRRQVPLVRVVITGAALSVLSQTPLMWPSGAGYWIVLAGLGLLSNMTTLCYPILSRHFPPALTGRATTALNMFFFVGAFAMQYMIGLVIDLVPTSTPGHYPVIAYQLAFAMMFTVQVSAWLWCLVKPREAAGQVEPAATPS